MSGIGANAGNGYQVNLLYTHMEKFRELHQVNLFWAGFSYLEPLCATVATAATAPSSVAHQDKRAKLVHISPFSLIDKSLQIKLRREVSFFCKIHFQIFKLPFLNKTSNLIL